MNNDFNETIMNKMKKRSSDELIVILIKNDEEKWSPEAFKAIKSILNERGVDSSLKEISDKRALWNEANQRIVKQMSVDEVKEIFLKVRDSEASGYAKQSVGGYYALNNPNKCIWDIGQRELEGMSSDEIKKIYNEVQQSELNVEKKASSRRWMMTAVAFVLGFIDAARSPSYYPHPNEIFVLRWTIYALIIYFIGALVINLLKKYDRSKMRRSQKEGV